MNLDTYFYRNSTYKLYGKISNTFNVTSPITHRYTLDHSKK